MFPSAWGWVDWVRGECTGMSQIQPRISPGQANAVIASFYYFSVFNLEIQDEENGLLLHTVPPTTNYFNS